MYGAAACLRASPLVLQVLTEGMKFLLCVIQPARALEFLQDLAQDPEMKEVDVCPAAVVGALTSAIEAKLSTSTRDPCFFYILEAAAVGLQLAEQDGLIGNGLLNYAVAAGVGSRNRKNSLVFLVANYRRTRGHPRSGPPASPVSIARLLTDDRDGSRSILVCGYRPGLNTEPSDAANLIEVGPAFIYFERLRSSL